MELSRIHGDLPLKKYSKDNLKKVIYNDLIVWISDLLSLTDEVSAKRLYVAIPSIEEFCWSMGIDEIKKMFTMYAQSKLSVKPISNYFDTILLGKIVESYKEQKPVKKVQIQAPEISQEEKDIIMFHGIVTCFDYYVQYNKFDESIIVTHYHDHLHDLRLLNFEKEVKVEMWKKAKHIAFKRLEKAKDLTEYKKFQKEIEKGDGTWREIEYKVLRLQKYFDQVIESGKHVKDLL